MNLAKRLGAGVLAAAVATAVIAPAALADSNGGGQSTPPITVTVTTTPIPGTNTAHVTYTVYLFGQVLFTIDPIEYYNG